MAKNIDFAEVEFTFNILQNFLAEFKAEVRLIRESRIKINQLAMRLSMSRTTLYKKLEDPETFTIPEIKTLYKELISFKHYGRLTIMK